MSSENTYRDLLISLTEAASPDTTTPKRLAEIARAARQELMEEAAERDIWRPGAEELPEPSRGELFDKPSRWVRPQETQIAASKTSSLVSIIIPLYNKQNVLRRCLTSVLGQTYPHLQILIVNDGSTDESLAVTSWLTRNDARVTIINKENGGVSAARNTALAQAQGKWLYFCDSDDWLEPDCIEKLVNAAETSNSDLAISGFYRVRGDRYDTRAQLETGAYSLAEFVDIMTKRPANYYYGSLWNKLFKRAIAEFNSLHFNENVRYGEDHIFILNYLHSCSSIAALKNPLYYYVDTPGSLIHQSMNPAAIAKNKTLTIEQYALLCESCGLAETTGDILKIATFLITPATDGFVMPFDKILPADHVPNN